METPAIALGAFVLASTVLTPQLFYQIAECGGQAPEVTYCRNGGVAGSGLHDRGLLWAEGNPEFWGTIDVYGFSHSTFQENHVRCHIRGTLSACLPAEVGIPTPYGGWYPVLGGIVVIEAYADGAGPWRAYVMGLR